MVVEILTGFVFKASVIGWLLSVLGGKVRSRVVELVDVFPTVSYLAGLEVPVQCPDISFQVSGYEPPVYVSNHKNKL